MHTPKIANIFDYIQDHSRLGLENKFLENKSRQIFLRSTGLLYKFLPTNLWVFKPTFYNFYTSHLRWNSTIYHTDLGQNAVFHNFSRQIALSQYSGRSIVGFKRNRSNISKITHTASWFSFLWCELSVWSSVWINFNRVTRQHNSEFIIIFFVIYWFQL